MKDEKKDEAVLSVVNSMKAQYTLMFSWKEKSISAASVLIFRLAIRK